MEASKPVTSANKSASWWVKEVARSVSAWKEYRERSEKTIKRYRDKRQDDVADISSKRFNILFSNVETLGPAIYSQVPIPDIRRRFLDKDPVGRIAADVLQRSVAYCLESYDFDAVLEACRLDYLLPSFAVARVQYKPYFKTTEKKGEDGQPSKDKDGKAAVDEELIYQEATTEYVAWDRFAMSRSKVYERVWWVAFGDDLTKDEIESKFGEEVANKLSYSRKEGENDDTEAKDGADPTTRVWEVWCKRDRKRFFVAEGYQDWVQKPESDPLRLERFFPNAKPIWAVSTNDTLEPVIEYYEYRDQALELDDLTERIDVLTSAIRRRGVYDQEFSILSQMLTGKGDNNFVAVENWASLMEKGGLERLAMEMPIDGLVKAVMELDNRRERVKQIIYEITGIGDIIRGASNPNETAKAQDIKSRWAGLRISTRQKKFANFARDLVRLKAELIAERFDAQTLSLMSGIELPMQEAKQQWQQAQAAQKQQAMQMQQAAQMAQQQGQQPPPMQPPPPPNPEEVKFYSQPTWEDVLQVLRDDKLRGFKIDIETDSTIQPDADAEKRARSELLTSLGGFSQAMVPAIQAGIVPKKLAIEAIQFTLRAFKVGSTFEQELDSMSEGATGPTPEQQAKEQQLQKMHQDLQKREAKVKDDEHGAQMAAKDAKAAATEVDHKKEIFDIEQRVAAEMKAMQDKFDQALHALADKAEHTVREIAGQPQGAVQ